jgi:hypothetical protein
VGIEINEVTENLDDAHRELIEAITVNSLVVQLYQKIRGPMNNPPVNDISVISPQVIMEKLPELENYSGSLRKLVLDRLAYWIRCETRMNWSTEKMMKRNRRKDFRDHLGIDSVCEWPGCEESSTLVSDHRFPFSMGGEDTFPNHGPLCRWHNLIKMNSPYMIIRWPGD